MHRHSKILFIDLDGTLLNSNDSVSSNNKKALVSWLDAGHSLFFVSGRPSFFVEHLAVTIDSRIGVISNNGAYMKYFHDVEEHNISSEGIEQVLIALGEYKNIQIYLKSLDCVYTLGNYDCRFMYTHFNEKDPSFPKIPSFVNLNIDDLKHHEDILKVLVYHEDAKVLKLARESLMSNELILISSYNSKSFDISKYRVDKGSMIQKVIEKYGFDIKESYAIGDQMNDISMLSSVENSIAMGNAIQEVKNICNHITLDNDHDGVSVAIDEILKNHLN